MAEDVKDIEYVSYETLDHVIYKLSKVYSGGQSEEIKWPIPIEKGGSGATTADDAWAAFGGGSVGKLNTNSNAGTFLNGSGQWSTPKDTTYEVATTTGSGLMPALSASATQYLNGNGEWTTVDNVANAAKAASADKLTTGHTITVQNGNATAATSAAFDGTSNVTINLANLDAATLTTGTIPLARIPQGALERIVDIANQAARFALTSSQVQLGDTVRQLDTGVMYVVVDESKLNQAAGYVEYAAGTALEAEHAKTADTATSANTATSATSAGSATTANSAAKLTSPRSLKTKLDSTTEVTFDGSGDQNAIPVTGTLGIANGGTGKTNAAEAWTNLGGGSVGKLNTGTDTTKYLRNDGQWITPPNDTYSVFGKSTSSSVGTNGLVPAPGAGADNRYLRNDGTWQVPPNNTYSAATTTSAGLMPALNSNAGQYLNGNGAWSTPPNTTYNVATTGSTGLMPALNGTATTYLNGSGQWSTPPNTNTDTNVKQDVSTANTAYPILLKNGTGNGSVTTTALFDEAVTINPSTNTITATTFAGNLTGNVTGNVSGSSGSCTGNAATATTAGNVTGTVGIDHGGTGATTKDAAWTALGGGSVGKLNTNGTATTYLNGSGQWSTPPNTTYGAASTTSAGLMPQLNGNTGQYLNGNGAWSTPPNTNTWIAFVGASATAAGTAGYVPAPGIGNQDKYFKGDGTWGAPTANGTVYVGTTQPTDSAYTLWVDTSS